MMYNSKVIVISGMMGSGKTTLINQLHQTLSNSKILSFDDYDIDALPSAPALELPLKETVNQYDIQRLLADFFAVQTSYPFILLDFPFGNRHQDIAPYIDQTIYIKTPLDIALARGILRDYRDRSAKEIMSWLTDYLENAREILLDYEAFISETADLTLDGTLSLATQTDLVLDLLKK